MYAPDDETQPLDFDEPPPQADVLDNARCHDLDTRPDIAESASLAGKKRMRHPEGSFGEVSHSKYNKPTEAQDMADI